MADDEAAAAAIAGVVEIGSLADLAPVLAERLTA